MNTTDPQSKSAPLIDFNQLHSACDGDEALMRELIDMYFTQADQIMAGLKKAVPERDIANVDHLSHKLAGSSLACGFSAIVPPLRRMEMVAKAGRLDGAEDSLAETVSTLELLRAAVQEYLRQGQSP